MLKALHIWHGFGHSISHQFNSLTLKMNRILHGWGGWLVCPTLGPVQGRRIPRATSLPPNPCKIRFLAFTIQNVHAIRKNVKIAGNVAMLWPRLTSMVMTSAKFGLRRFPRLVCLLTLNRAKKCACRLSNTSVQDKEI